MKIRNTGPVVLVLLVGGVSPVLADCCSSFLDCAATVVTEGVSCEIETILTTIRNLVTLVNNIVSDVTGKTQNAEQSARKLVSDTINTMQSQAQQSAADLAAAQAQAETLFKQESTIRDIAVTDNNLQNMTQAAAPTAGGPPLQMTTQRNQSLATAAKPTAGPTIGLVAGTQVAISSESIMAPHGAYADAFSRGVKQIAALKSTSDTDLSRVIGRMAAAQASEGPGVAQADTLAGAMQSPLSSMQSQLSSMLSHPLSAFDPTSAVDTIENTITTNMSANLSQMIDDITAGPNTEFAAAQPNYDDLLMNAESAQAIAAAMDQLYRMRTQAAATALYSLLPKQNFAGVTSRVGIQATLAGNFGQRLSYGTIASRLAAGKKTALLAYQPANISQVHALVTQFKAQRAQGKSALPQSAMLPYRNTVSQQLNGYFNGKSSAAIISQRDQLISQARIKYATDPNTENGVINLLNSEAAKRTASAIPPVPGQPVMGLAVPTAAPVSQAKAPAWGTGATPSWTPPTATGAQVPGVVGAPGMQAITSFKPASTLKPIQPIQQQQMQQTAPARTAPSSLSGQ